MVILKLNGPRKPDEVTTEKVRQEDCDAAANHPIFGDRRERYQSFPEPTFNTGFLRNAPEAIQAVQPTYYSERCTYTPLIAPTDHQLQMEEAKLKEAVIALEKAPQLTKAMKRARKASNEATKDAFDEKKYQTYRMENPVFKEVTDEPFLIEAKDMSHHIRCMYAALSDSSSPLSSLPSPIKDDDDNDDIDDDKGDEEGDTAPDTDDGHAMNVDMVEDNFEEGHGETTEENWAVGGFGREVEMEDAGDLVMPSGEEEEPVVTRTSRKRSAVVCS